MKGMTIIVKNISTWVKVLIFLSSRLDSLNDKKE